MESVWSPAVVKLGRYGDKSPQRLGFVDQHGLVALPPKSVKRQSVWFKKMKITPEAISAFQKMS